MRKPLLCIGGPRHGETLAVEGSMYQVQMAAPSSARDVADFWREANPSPFVSFKTTTYTVERFGFSATGRTVRFLRHESISQKTAEAWFCDHLANLYEGG